jgi:gluconolactonase
MILDERGNLYITTDAVHVFNPGGKHLGSIKTAERPANVAFGGDDGRTLFITARTSLYAIRMRLAGQ